MKKRPCTWAALCLITGVLAGEYPESLQNQVTTIGILFGFLRYIGLQGRYLALGAIIMVLGWANHRLHTNIVSKNDLRLIIGNQPRLVTVEGTVSALPQSRAIETSEKTLFRTQVLIEVQMIAIGNRSMPASGKVMVQVDQPLRDDFDPGSIVSIRGCIKRPDPPLVPNAFNLRRHLRNRDIYYQIQLPDWDPNITLLTPPKRRPLPARFQAWARKTLTIGQVEEGAEIRLIWAMVVGYRTWLNGERREPFLQSGTLHVFAISGLHIAMIASFMVTLARTLRIPRRHAALLVIPALWFYTAATGYPSSAIRASTVSSIILLGWVLRRPPEILNSLGVAVILLLTVDPLQLFQPGFQLSFTVVTSLILLFPKLSRIATRLVPDYSMIPTQSQSTFQKMATRISHKTCSTLSVSLAAWLGSVPLVAIYFNLLTPVSILTNLLLIPIAGLTMASAFMSLATAAWIPAIAALANSSAWFWMKAMIWLCKGAAALPGAHIAVSPFPISWCLIYYITLLTWAISPSMIVSRTAITLGSLTAIGMAYLTHLTSQRQTTITFLPIPDADAILIDAPGRSSDMLIDGGPLWSSKRALQPYLASLPPFTKINQFLLTHGDKQHVEVLPQLVTKQQPATIITTPLRYRSGFYRQLINDLDNQGHRLKPVAFPDHIGRWLILHPTPESPASPADHAPLVLLGKLHGTQILLLSDLDRSMQKEILNREPTLEVDVLCLNLPAKLTPPNHYVIRQLNPQVIIVTGSDTAKGGRWVEDLRRQLNESRTKLLFTGTEGAIVLTLRDSETTICSQTRQPFTLRYRTD